MMVPIWNLAQIKLLKLLSNDSFNVYHALKITICDDLGLINRFEMGFLLVQVFRKEC